LLPPFTSSLEGLRGESGNSGGKRDTTDELGTIAADVAGLKDADDPGIP